MTPGCRRTREPCASSTSILLQCEGTMRSSIESVIACPDRDVPAARKVMGVLYLRASSSVATTCAGDGAQSLPCGQCQCIARCHTTIARITPHVTGSDGWPCGANGASHLLLALGLYHNLGHQPVKGGICAVCQPSQLVGHLRAYMCVVVVVVCVCGHEGKRILPFSHG